MGKLKHYSVIPQFLYKSILNTNTLVSYMSSNFLCSEVLNGYSSDISLSTIQSHTINKDLLNHLHTEL